MWAYIQGLIKIDAQFCESETESDYYIQSVLDSLPPINGSEGDCRFQLVPNAYRIYDRSLVAVYGALRHIEPRTVIRETSRALTRLSKRLSVDGIALTVTTGYDGELIYDFSQHAKFYIYNLEPIKLPEPLFPQSEDYYYDRRCLDKPAYPDKVRNKKIRAGERFCV